MLPQLLQEEAAKQSLEEVLKEVVQSGKMISYQVSDGVAGKMFA